MQISKCLVRCATMLMVLSVLFASSAVTLRAQSIPLDEPDPIDMQTDVNSDQLPDELVAELEAIEAAVNSDSDPDVDTSDIAAMTSLLQRVPLDDSTLAAQEQVQQLLADLNASDDPQQSEALARQIDELLEQARSADAGYDLLLDTVEALMEQDTQNDPFAAPYRLFLPSVQGGSAGASAAAEQPAAMQGAPDFSRLQRGHIMFIRGDRWYLNWIYAMTYSHAGAYDGNSLVYESTGDGVRLQPLAHWQEPGHSVGLAYNNKKSAAEVQAAMDWAKQTYKTDGTTAYNYVIPDKWSDEKLYCSQLVWKIHGHLGIDLDSNNFWYILWITANLGPAFGPGLAIPAVMPDEIARDSEVTVYSSGVTK
jgi:hypothetical protein